MSEDEHDAVKAWRNASKAWEDSGKAWGSCWLPDAALIAWCALGGLAVAVMFGGMIWCTLEAMGPWRIF